MKIILNKIVSSIATFLVLFSAFSFTMDSNWSDFLIIVSYIDEPKVCKSDIKVNFHVKIKVGCTNQVQTIKDQDELHAHVSKKIAATKEQFVPANFISHSLLRVDEFSKLNTSKKKIIKKDS
jgi:hypothetical protein